MEGCEYDREGNPGTLNPTWVSFPLPLAFAVREPLLALALHPNSFLTRFALSNNSPLAPLV